MRRLLVAVTFLSLIECLALSQVYKNAWDGEVVVEPGVLCTAQYIIVDTTGIGTSGNSLKFPSAAAVVQGTWSNPGKAGEDDGNCASTTESYSVLALTGFGFDIPLDSYITGIKISVKMAATGNGMVWIGPTKDGQEPTWEWMREPPSGDCSGTGWISVGGLGHLWGTSWTPAEINSSSFGVIINVSGQDFTLFVDAVEVEIYYSSGTPVSITGVFLQNTAPSDEALTGTHIERIEIWRGDTYAQMGYVEGNALRNFATNSGVTMNVTQNNLIPPGTEVGLYVLIKLKPTAPLFKKIVLGNTKVNNTLIDYSVPAPVIVIGPLPRIEHDQDVSDGTVYPAQRFLAARILVDATEVPSAFTITQLTIRNIGDGIPLSGRYVASIEVRRAADGALLGEQTSPSELEKFTTHQGTLVPTTKNNQVSAYSETALEIWITLKADAPLGHKIQVAARVRYEGTDALATGSAPEFTVVKREALGLEGVSSVTLPSKGVVPGQTFRAQQLKLEDNDPDPHDVRLSSILVRNVGDPLLADQHITKIEVRRAGDDAVLGASTDLSGLSTTGVRIPLSAHNVIPDDTAAQIDIYVTISDAAPLNRKVKISSQIWYSEGGASLQTDALEGPAEFTVKAPEGLEKVENKTTAQTDQNVYPGQTFMAQKIYLEDKDDDPYGVTLTRILVKNLSPSSPILDAHVASIEVRDATGKLLGQTTTISGLTKTGVWVSTTANNVIADDKNLTIEIWITLKSDVPAGKKLTLGARIEHSEGGKTFTKPDAFLSSGVEFTTATTGGRTVSFTYSPDKPKWRDEITFTPSVNPSTGVVYARWEFGDGKVVERKTAEGENPLAPIKHTYNKGGDFTVVYVVRDEANRETRAAKKITVTNEPPKDVDFSFSPAAPEANQTVTFTPSDKITDPDGDIKKATFRWDFGDGSAAVTSTGPRNVTHAYTQAGTYTVTLTVTDQGGATATAKKDVRVGETAPPPPQPPTVTNITANPPYPETGQAVTFTATATAPAEAPVSKWKWDFGDGSDPLETTENTTTHIYQNPGTYTVSVQAQNSAGWSAIRSLPIVVHPAGVEFGAVVIDNPVTGNQCRIQIFAPTGATDLKINILDQAGRIVVRDKPVNVGIFTWDLRDQNGRTVANGLYLFYITAKIGGETRRTEIGRVLVRR